LRKLPIGAYSKFNFPLIVFSECPSNLIHFNLFMTEPLQTETMTDPIPSANDLLALQITQTLRDAELIAASDEAEVLKMLTVGNVKAGDWLQVVQKRLLLNSTPIEKHHAATNHSA
jgi:hypothetical protein